MNPSLLSDRSNFVTVEWSGRESRPRPVLVHFDRDDDGLGIVTAFAMRNGRFRELRIDAVDRFNLLLPTLNALVAGTNVGRGF